MSVNREGQTGDLFCYCMHGENNFQKVVIGGGNRPEIWTCTSELAADLEVEMYSTV
jgi:hypothetical protein